MKHIEHSAIVPFSSQQMYDLVNDVARYPEFLQWCSATSILLHSDTEMTAKLEVAMAGIKKSFTTCNQLTPYESIRMDCIDGPFKHFHAVWHFHVLEAYACKAIYSMHYQFKNKLMGLMVGPLFEKIGDTMVEAFVKRARDVYVAD